MNLNRETLRWWLSSICCWCWYETSQVPWWLCWYGTNCCYVYKIVFYHHCYICLLMIDMWYIWPSDDAWRWLPLIPRMILTVKQVPSCSNWHTQHLLSGPQGHKNKTGLFLRLTNIEIKHWQQDFRKYWGNWDKRISENYRYWHCICVLLLNSVHCSVAAFSGAFLVLWENGVCTWVLLICLI